MDLGFGTVEPSQDAEDAWVTLLLSGPGTMIGGPDCTPGYYNNEGQDSGAFLGRGYPYGPSATSPTSTSGAHPARSMGWSSGNDGLSLLGDRNDVAAWRWEPHRCHIVAVGSGPACLGF